jgi:glyoxalase family protein
MSLIAANHAIRIARPTRSLKAAERFWCEGVGLEVLWRTGTEAVGGHSLLMVGAVGAPWHLELVEDPDTLDAHPPSAEDLLVIYRGHPIDQTEIQQLLLAGGKVVPARNPYWDEYGITIADPDGYRLVLSHRTWGVTAEQGNNNS